MSCTGKQGYISRYAGKAEPTQHKHLATTAALTVTGDRDEKLQEDRAAQKRHSAVITKRSTDSVSSKGQNILTRVKSTYVVLKAVITSYLLFLYELKKIFYLSDDSMPEIFCMKHFYIFPLA